MLSRRCESLTHAQHLSPEEDLRHRKTKENMRRRNQNQKSPTGF